MNQTLEELAKLLRKKTMSALDISLACGCSKPTAYARVAALLAAGEKVDQVVDEDHHGRTGPRPVKYRIVGAK